MRILFWGTPEFAVPALRALDEEGYDVVGVVTQPDRPAGRGRRLRPSAVKQAALAQEIAVMAPDRPVGDEFLADIRALEPDISVVVAYGHILRREVLDVPRMGSINVHASLLPALRGAAPINWAVARGHERTGVTIMRMVEAMDAGPVIHTVGEPILEDETASDLTLRLSELGAAALIEALALLGAGAAVEVEQDHSAATFAPKIDRATARIDWSCPATDIGNLIRAMDSVPGAWSVIGGTEVKLFGPAFPSDLSSDVSSGVASAAPGAVVGTALDAGLVVATGAGLIRLAEVQPAGKRRMAAADWIRGRGVEAGQRFE